VNDKQKGQTLEEFLFSMNSRIQEQSDSMMKVGTTLVDLTQELEIVIKELIDRAIQSRKDLKKAWTAIELHNKLGSTPEDDDLIEKAWTAVGEVNGYLWAATTLRDMCKNVLGRKDETKH